jgi:hypothetical protein
MKATKQLFFFLLGTSLIFSCVSAESELLHQARTIQDETMASVHLLDSSMTVKISSLNEDRSALAMDTTLSTDSIKLKSFMILKDKIDNITNLQSELTNWKSNVKMLPTAKEIDGGAENPFGEKAKDQEILSQIKTAQEEFQNLKIKAEAAMK